MPEVITLGLILAAAVTGLVVLAVWDFQRQRLRITSGQYEERIKALEARATELELENVRLRDDLQFALRLSQKETHRLKAPDA